MLYSGSEYKPPITPFICAGDRVQLVMDIELLKSRQTDIGAWDPSITEVYTVFLHTIQ